MLMSSSNFYSEQLFDQARANGTDQDNWMSVVYEYNPLAYIRSQFRNKFSNILLAYYLDSFNSIT